MKKKLTYFGFCMITAIFNIYNYIGEKIAGKQDFSPYY